LFDIDDGFPVATATINLVEEKIDKDKVFIKDYSENKGMTEALITAGNIHRGIHGTVKSGFVNIDLYQLTKKAMKDLFNE